MPPPGTKQSEISKNQPFFFYEYEGKGRPGPALAHLTVSAHMDVVSLSLPSMETGATRP